MIRRESGLLFVRQVRLAMMDRPDSFRIGVRRRIVGGSHDLDPSIAGELDTLESGPYGRAANIGFRLARASVVEL
jgi:hypothetical protein